MQYRIQLKRRNGTTVSLPPRYSDQLPSWGEVIEVKLNGATVVGRVSGVSHFLPQTGAAARGEQDPIVLLEEV